MPPLALRSSSCDRLPVERRIDATYGHERQIDRQSQLQQCPGEVESALRLAGEVSPVLLVIGATEKLLEGAVVFDRWLAARLIDGTTDLHGAILRHAVRDQTAHQLMDRFVARQFDNDRWQHER